MSKNFIKYLVFSVLFFVTLSIVFNLAIVDNPHFNIYDLALNLLSEFAGMIFTVVVFNEFLNQREKLSLANKSKLLYQDLERWLDNLAFTFYTPARKFIPDFDDGQLWTEQTFRQLGDCIKLDEFETEKPPQMPWYLFLGFQGMDLENNCQGLLERFQDLQENEVAGVLAHFLHVSDMIRTLPDIKTILEADVIMGHTRPRKLAHYYNGPAPEDFAKIAYLKQWTIDCRKTEQASVVRNKRLSKISLVLFGVVFPVVGVKTLLSGQALFSLVYFAASAVYVGLYLYNLYETKRKTQKRR